MTNTFRNLRIYSDRMLAAFDELARIGATGDGGVHRPAFSEAHLAARQWFQEQIENSDLEFRSDGAGNHSAVLPIIMRSGATKQSPTQYEIASGQPKPLTTLAPGASAGVTEVTWIFFSLALLLTII